MKEKLAQSWSQVYDNAGKAINWLKEVREAAPKVDNIADKLILELRHTRNTAKALSEVSTQQLTAGVFGVSQAGKSYLLSSLIRGKEDHTLMGNFGGSMINFKDDLNPPGGGNEATGLVTRFTYGKKTGIEGYPIELRLFSEADLVKILMNTYFSDFDRDRIENQPFASHRTDKTKSDIAATINTVSKNSHSPKVVSGINEDDIVDLQVYAKNWSNSTAFLDQCYWPQVIDLAPHLSIADRAQLFAILWGYDPDFTEMYKSLANTLARLGHPSLVYAPLNSIVVPKSTGQTSGFRTAEHNIIDVTELRRWGTNHTADIEVVPASSDGKNINSAETVNSADLSALTSEFIFPLSEEPQISAFKHVDLLDFPGYRSRLKITTGARDATEDGNSGSGNDQFNPVALCFLRGKVAYLFERYTQRQEMNILVMCTPTHKQTEVAELPDVLARWINATQGATPSERHEHPGLVWALTIFDAQIKHALDQSKKDRLSDSYWTGLFTKTNLNSGFNQEWRKNWSNGKPFKNIFLVRTPGLPEETGTFIKFDEANPVHEVGLLQQEELEKVKASFVNDSNINDYIDNPAEAWDAVLGLNDGGAARVGRSFENISSPSIKNDRLKRQLNNIIEKLIRELPKPARTGAEAIDEKNTLAHDLLEKIGARIEDFGELLYRLQLPEPKIRALYKNQSSRGASGTGIAKRNNGFGIRKNNAVVEKEEQVPHSSFAQEVYKAWVEHMKGLSKDANFVRYFGIVEEEESEEKEAKDQTQPMDEEEVKLPTTKTIDDFVDEICVGANRCKVPQRLSEVALANQDRGYTYEELVDIQTFSMSMVMSDFLAWLGFINLPLNKRPDCPDPDRVEKIFSPYEIEMQDDVLPKLDDITQNFNFNYCQDWATGFVRLAEDNAGYAEGLDWDIQQNATLLKIVDELKQSEIQ